MKIIFNKKLYYLTGVILVCAIIILMFVIFADEKISENKNQNVFVNENTDSDEIANTRFPVPDGTRVPGPGEEGLAKRVAVPEEIFPSRPNSSSMVRYFSIKADDGKFSPDTVIVKKGDIVHVRVEAVDKKYDFVQPDYGFNIEIPKGSYKEVEFSATASGMFMYYCASCGSSRETSGYIVITEK